VDRMVICWFNVKFLPQMLRGLLPPGSLGIGTNTCMTESNCFDRCRLGCSHNPETGGLEQCFGLCVRYKSKGWE
jgi:hypothetical protein